MLFITPEGEYPRHIGDLKLAHPEWEQGQPLPTGWLQVAYAQSLPSVGEYEIIYEAEPSEVDGVLTQTFAVRAMTAEEKEKADAPKTAKQKLLSLGLTEFEIEALVSRMVR